MDWYEFKSWSEIRLSKPPFIGDYPTTGKYNFPKLAQVNYLPELPVLPFNYLKSTKDRENYWFHCFTEPKYFHKLYSSFQNYVELLRQTKGLISADFSLYRDYPEEILIDNCRGNRLVDYALQQEGIPMIPTAGFAGESSWEWCFDGFYKFFAEVKGVISLNPSQIAKQIRSASEQIEGEHSRHPEEERLPAKIVLISLHETLELGYRLIYEGYQEAKRKNWVNFNTEFWFKGEIKILE